MGDSLDFLGIDLHLVVVYYNTNCIPISLNVSIFPDSPFPRFPDSPIPYFSNSQSIVFDNSGGGKRKQSQQKQ